MKSIKMRGVVAAVTGALLFGFGANAMADSTTDIVNALVAKGVLTEEEGALLAKGREGEITGQAKAMKKATKLSVSDAVDSAKLYGSFRLREEYRNGEGYSNASDARTADSARTRTRGKFELGVSTEVGKWYGDIAIAAGSSGRSDNFTFGGDSATEFNPKESIYLKRAMLGWKPTEWLALEGGRMKNPLYTTSMVWDADYSLSGLSEKFNFKTQGGTEWFVNLGQWANVRMDRTLTDNISTGAAPISTSTGEIYAFQGGFKTPITDKVSSAKLAVTHYEYGSPSSRGAAYDPGLPNRLSVEGKYSVKDLNIWEVPAEINYMVRDNIGLRVFGEYVYNADGDKRATAAGYASENDDTSWMLGLKVASAKDLAAFEGNKQKAGDWQATLWYQETGAFAQDQNLSDSDLFDSRLNMKGVVLKANYFFEDNVSFDLTAAHAERNNDNLGTNWSKGADITALNLTDFNLLQLDVNYKF